MNQDLELAIEAFDLDSYIEDNFSVYRRVLSNQDEVQIDCFAPNGCNGSDTKQHLYVNTDKKRWYCHKCGYGDSKQQAQSSSLIRFLADVEGVSLLEIIGRLLGEAVPTPDEDLEEYLLRAFEGEPERAPTLKNVIKLPRELYSLKGSGRASESYRRYAFTRGFREEDFGPLDLRYVIHYRFPETNGRTFSWKWRLVFPIVDLEGNYRSAVGRSITPKQKNAWAAWPSSDIRNLIWPLGHYIDSKWCPVTLRSSTAVLTEGVADAYAVNTLTEHQAFCTFGKKISDPQAGILSSLGVTRLIIAWDKDAKEQIKRAASRLSGRFEVCVFPFRSHGWDEFDFGDVLSRKMSNYREAEQLLRDELGSPVSVDSPEFCSWVIGF